MLSLDPKDLALVTGGLSKKQLQSLASWFPGAFPVPDPVAGAFSPLPKGVKSPFARR